MATMVKLCSKTDQILSEINCRQSEAEEKRAEEFSAALKIQAWVRGTRSRSYFKHLNRCAVSIQSRWRGFLGRRNFREFLTNQLFLMKLNHYNSMAVKIQKVWRGFYSRKYVANYYSRKRYLEGLVLKNELIRTELEDHVEHLETMKMIEREREEKKKHDTWAKKNHFLVSTQVIPGIYNSPFLPYPSEMEFHLRDAKPKPERKTSKKSASKEGVVFDPSWKRYDAPRLDPLPPVQPKPQGPFRSPREVQGQRYKEWQPTLRVATDFYSLEKARRTMKEEEWVTRLHDEVFIPFTKKDANYDPLLHTTSKYGHLSYGTKFFRKELPDQWLTKNKNFRSVVPPIPLFEKMNDTYSQGQV